MTVQPTDADRQRAQELMLDHIIPPPGIPFAVIQKSACDAIAAAIAAARAEGFEAGLREPERRARQLLGDQARGISASNLKEPGHGK